MSPRRALVRLLATTVAAALLLVLSAGTVVAAELVDSSVYGPGIENYPEYEGQERCQPRSGRPGVAGFRDTILERYPTTGDGGIARACHLGGPSLHKEGRAWDWMVDATDPAEREMADEVLRWLLETDEHGNEHAMARRLGVMYIIFDRRVWSAQSPGSWTPYRGPSPHTDHVHIGFSTDGAEGRTSYWNPPGEPAERAERPPAWFLEFLAGLGLHE